MMRQKTEGTGTQMTVRYAPWKKLIANWKHTWRMSCRAGFLARHLRNPRRTAVSFLLECLLKCYFVEDCPLWGAAGEKKGEKDVRSARKGKSDRQPGRQTRQVGQVGRPGRQVGSKAGSQAGRVLPVRRKKAGIEGTTSSLYLSSRISLFTDM